MFPVFLVTFQAAPCFTEVKQHDRMVALVESMLALHNQSACPHTKQGAAARLPDEKERLQRQIKITDKQIDKLVYELYGLSVEEIQIVEESSQGRPADALTLAVAPLFSPVNSLQTSAFPYIVLEPR